MNPEARIEQAMEDFRFAYNELMRPEEDVVLISACLSLRRSIRGFLQAYLTSVKIKFTPENSLEELMLKCKEYNPEFNRFAMQTLRCRCDDGNCGAQSYCMEMEQVTECQVLLNDISDYVIPEVRKKA